MDSNRYDFFLSDFFSKSDLLQAERSRKQAELLAAEHKEALNELVAQNMGLTSVKRKLESELQVSPRKDFGKQNLNFSNFTRKFLMP